MATDSIEKHMDRDHRVLEWDFERNKQLLTGGGNGMNPDGEPTEAFRTGHVAGDVHVTMMPPEQQQAPAQVAPQVQPQPAVGVAQPGIPQPPSFIKGLIKKFLPMALTAFGVGGLGATIIPAIVNSMWPDPPQQPPVIQQPAPPLDQGGIGVLGVDR